MRFLLYICVFVLFMFLGAFIVGIICRPNASPVQAAEDQIIFAPAASPSYTLDVRGGNTDAPFPADPNADTIITLPNATGWIVTYEEKQLLERLVREAKR